MTNIRNALMQAAGSAGGDKVYVEDVFSTFLYTGNGSNGLAIDNGIDLAGEGGLVWIKDRASANHSLATTDQGLTNQLASDLTNGNISWGNMQSFDSDGFTLTNGGTTNTSTNEYASWTFRKAPGFFDVVTYTGDGTSARTISHNLGCKPGMIIVKRTDTSADWQVWHRNTGLSYGVAHLNTSTAWTNTGGDNAAFYDANGSATNFTLGQGSRLNDTNANSATYIAYLFAGQNDADSQIFGEDGDEAIIRCGSYTQGTTSSTTTGNVTVDVGFEPQWLLVKNATSASSWEIYDSMRGVTVTTSAAYPISDRLRPDTDDPENNTGQVSITSTGFTVHGGASTTSDIQIYMAIRRGPMKEPDAGTDVFNGVLTNSDSSGFTGFPVTIGFPVDWAVVGYTTLGTQGINVNRLTGATETTQPARLMTYTYSTGAAANTGELFGADNMTGYRIYGHTYQRICYGFRRWPKVFDTVVYQGNASPSVGVRNGLNHALTVAPELVLHKRLDSTSEWQAGASVVSKGGYFNLDNSFPTSFTPANEFTATTFDVDGWISENNNNVSGGTYICYLFATLAGISKVGSYSGTGSDVNVDCGFSGGARFVMVKRVDSTGDWFYWDTIRGIVAGNDPYLVFNEAEVEVTNTDYIDPLSSGFTITSSAPAALNASGGTYLFLAFA